MRLVVSLAILVLTLGSCDTYSEEQISGFDKEINTYINKKGLDLEKSSSGLYYTILEKGEGRDIQYKDVVSFTYKGSLLNGKMFADQTEPIEFEVSQLIGCWKEIMLNLKPGGKAILISPPQLGYGTHKLDDIPKNSILYFEMEVVGVK